MGLTSIWKLCHALVAADLSCDLNCTMWLVPFRMVAHSTLLSEEERTARNVRHVLNLFAWSPAVLQGFFSHFFPQLWFRTRLVLEMRWCFLFVLYRAKLQRVLFQILSLAGCRPSTWYHSWWVVVKCYIKPSIDISAYSDKDNKSLSIISQGARQSALHVARSSCLLACCSVRVCVYVRERERECGETWHMKTVRECQCAAALSIHVI